MTFQPARDTDQTADSVIASGRNVLETEAGALRAMAAELGDSFVRAVDTILLTEGRLIVAGIGKSGHVGRKIAATFASTGTPAHFVHAAEASHGDLGMIASRDCCILLSNSGETRELGDLISYTRRFAIPLIALTRVAGSTLATKADIVLLLPDAPEACAIGMAPTTSTTASMAMGDALAVAVMRRRGFDPENFRLFHPGGKLGAQLMRVADLMHTGDALPLVTEETPMPDVLVRMSGAGYGVALVAEAGRLTGIITDGDLRRNMEGLLARVARDVATRAPKTIGPGALVSEAVGMMNRAKVNALCVVDEGGTIQGMIRLHDCLRAGVV
ncbi:MAG: KpsF/GutQ family sugar-phosphate isomerase [Pararhodobacter sp.]